MDEEKKIVAAKEAEKKGFLSDKIDPETHKKTNKNGYIVLGVFGGIMALVIAVSVLGAIAPSFNKGSTKSYLYWTNALPGFYDKDDQRLLDGDGNMAGSFGLENRKDADNKDYYAVTSINAPEGAKTLVMPSSYNGASITQIADIDTSKNANIFGESPTSSLEMIFFPSLYYTVGSYAFENMSSLTGLYFGSDESKVQTLKEGAFKGNPSLKEVVFSKSLREIGVSCFEGSSALTSVDLSKSALLYIGDKAFLNGGLNNITLPTSLTKIGSKALQSTSPLKISYLGTKAEWNRMQIASDALPADVTVSCLDGTIE